MEAFQVTYIVWNADPPVIQEPRECRAAFQQVVDGGVTSLPRASLPRCSPSHDDQSLHSSIATLPAKLAEGRAAIERV